MRLRYSWMRYGAARNRKSITKNAISRKRLEPATSDFEHACRSTRRMFGTTTLTSGLEVRTLENSTLNISETIWNWNSQLGMHIGVYGFYVRFESQGHVTSGSGVMEGQKLDIRFGAKFWAHFSPRRAIDMEMKLICTYEALLGRKYRL